jgi:hypothetical protein
MTEKRKINSANSEVNTKSICSVLFTVEWRKDFKRREDIKRNNGWLSTTQPPCPCPVSYVQFTLRR